MRTPCGSSPVAAIIEDSANGGVAFNRRLWLEHSQYAGDIGDHDRSDIARMQRREMDAQGAIANRG